ncbi:MAG: OmpA family protein [Burkholderiales bacterium]
MRRNTNRLLMLLIGAAVAACSTQTERGSTGVGAETTPPPAEAVSTPPADPGPLPEPEEVQFSEAPLPEAPEPEPEPEPEPVVIEQEVADFPITEYALPDEPVEAEVDELGPVAEPEPIYYPEQDLGDEDLGVSEPELYYPEQDLAEADTGVSEPETFYYDQELPEQDLGVSDPTTYYDYPGPVVTVEFATEPLFNFDKYDIRSDQITKLDEFVSNISDLTYETIWAVGHADRIGTVTYNQGLSERRANSIKSYLVRQGIPANKIRTLGRSKHSPVTGSACENERGQELISCLQPDRRVELSVTGTKAE